MMKQRKQKPSSEMTTDELRAATKEFDTEFVSDTFRPLTGRDRELHRRARKPTSSPAATNGDAKVISVRLARRLVDRADAAAKRRGITRARLIAEGLSLVLAKAG